MSSDPNQTPPPDALEQPGTLPADDGSQTALPRKPRILIGSQRDPAAFSHKPKRDWTTGDRKRRRRHRGRAEGEGEAAPEDAAAPAGPDSPGAEAEEVASAQAPEPLAPAPLAPEPAAQVEPEAAVVAPEASEAKPQAAAVSPQVAETLSPAPAPPSDIVEEHLVPQTAPLTVHDAPPPADHSPPPIPVPPVPSPPSAAAAKEEPASADAAPQAAEPEWTPRRKYPVPNLRGRLSDDLAAEFDEAIGGVPLDELLVERDEVTRQPGPELESRQKGRVVRVHRDDVFVELGGREQGVIPLKQFPEPPAPGAEVEVVVHRFNADDGLYELSLPALAASVADWSELSEGMVVEARVTGHNTGGLECDVNHIRAFVPVSQVALYRVQDMAEFVGQKLLCLVTECNPQRGNLVLSRRAVLEREKEAARKEMLESLQPGQVREGVVRKIMPFGAFVDLGSGVDGLLHVSRLSWARVEHPGEIVKEGQTVQVKVEKVDQATGRISLSYREMQENPWTRAAEKFPPNAMVRGKVRKLMDFGAFVEVEPGVEGLVHVSELSHKRVWRASDVVKEGDEVEVLVLSVDAEAQRMSLSMRQALPAPEKTAQEKRESEPQEAAPLPKKLRQKPSQPLRGGLGGPGGGDQFGLKW